MKITFFEPPSIGEKTPERFAGCSYELYHFPDLANLYPFTCLYEEGFDVNYIDASLEKLDENSFLNKTDLHYIKKIQEIRPSSKVIFHGPEPTRVPEEYLINDRVFVFRGEIE